MIDWTKIFEGIGILHRKQDFLDYDKGKNCSDCVIKPIMNCFICKIERACKTCSDIISQKKTYSSDINMLKRKPANENYRLLPYYISEDKPEQENTDFESPGHNLMKEEY